jgi:hypothetical protein
MFVEIRVAEEARQLRLLDALIAFPPVGISSFAVETADAR